jgi:hypothetical protein
MALLPAGRCSYRCSPIELQFGEIGFEFADRALGAVDGAGDGPLDPGAIASCLGGLPVLRFLARLHRPAEVGELPLQLRRRFVDDLIRVARAVLGEIARTRPTTAMTRTMTARIQRPFELPLEFSIAASLVVGKRKTGCRSGGIQSATFIADSQG